VKQRVIQPMHTACSSRAGGVKVSGQYCCVCNLNNVNIGIQRPLPIHAHTRMQAHRAHARTHAHVELFIGEGGSNILSSGLSKESRPCSSQKSRARPSSAACRPHTIHAQKGVQQLMRQCTACSSNHSRGKGCQCGQCASPFSHRTSLHSHAQAARRSSTQPTSSSVTSRSNHCGGSSRRSAKGGVGCRNLALEISSLSLFEVPAQLLF
jgi:hypothetical protein